MKSLMSFLLGIVLTIIGAVLFLSRVRVSNFDFFYHYHDVNITALLLLVICILLVVYVVYSNFWTGILLGLSFIVFLVSIIMSLDFYVTHMSALELIIMLGMIFGGIGLTFRGIVHAKDDSDDSNQSDKTGRM